MISAPAFHAGIRRRKDHRHAYEDVTFLNLHMIDKALGERGEQDNQQDEDDRFLAEKLPPELADLADVFSREDSNRMPPSRPGVDHKIELTGPAALRTHPLYSLNREQLETMKEYLQDSLQKGFIEPSSAQFGSPLTKKDRQAFHRIRLEPDSVELTAFRTRYGQFHYKVLPSGYATGLTPRCKKELQSFLGFCNFYLLVHFIEDRETKLETDASDGVIAGVLSQLADDGQWHPVSFLTKTMNAAECNYEIHDKELLAIIIFTDHQALQYFATKRMLNARQARWIETLAMVGFEIHYRPGKQNVVADALSRKAQDQLSLQGHDGRAAIAADKPRPQTLEMGAYWKDSSLSKRSSRQTGFTSLRSERSKQRYQTPGSKSRVASSVTMDD
ncbi:retrotransposon nucleocapsid protein [Hirsutella rhossiliensis]